MRTLIARLAALGDVGIAAVRVGAGIILAYHGWLKVTGGYAVGFLGNVGIPLPQVVGPFVSIVELVGGLALIAGLFSRYLGAIFFIEFLVVLWVRIAVLGKGYAGSEFELLILVVAAMLATNGGGTLSLDRMFRRWEP